ncbi:MAG: YmdB family metallophosphoesterase [Mycoplasma sp.]|nr:YmdB family metallophosphoesterase [Mycoplasma sp.]
MKILFIGDIFGESGIQKIENELPKLIDENKIDFVIAQSENVSGRKGLEPNDYKRLKKVGVNVFTLGNHAFAKSSISEIINNGDILRPYNVDDEYDGIGTNVFEVNGKKIRVTSLLGITFNDLNSPWKQSKANNFFDAIDEIVKNDHSDFHIIDFHAETTSEKNVFALYLDKYLPGKVTALLGTHTHVQTNDAKKLDNNLLYITDAGMTGPKNSAIGADFEDVYKKMRYNAKSKFNPSKNESELNCVLLTINNGEIPKIEAIKK